MPPDDAALFDAQDSDNVGALAQSDEGIVTKLRNYRQQHNDAHPLVCLLDNPDNHFFHTVDGDQVGYFSPGNVDIVIGGLIAPMARKHALLTAYLENVRQRKKQVVFIHFTQVDALLLNERQFCVNQLGASYTIDLRTYDMAGKRFQQLRNKIHRAEKAGVSVQEIKTQTHFAQILPSLQHINKLWLKEKGGKQLKGLVTDFDALSLPDMQHRLAVAFLNNEAVAYILYTRIHGDKPGWFHDLSRKLHDVPDGVMQLLNREMLTHFQAENIPYLHFGFTPLVEMDNVETFKGSQMFGRIARLLARHGGVVYPAVAQRQYKMSWRPQLIEQEYIAFPEGQALKALWSVLKATNSI